MLQQAIPVGAPPPLAAWQLRQQQPTWHVTYHCQAACLQHTDLSPARCSVLSTPVYAFPVQVVDMDYCNEAMKRMVEGDVHFRFVIDINKSLVM